MIRVRAVPAKSIRNAAANNFSPVWYSVSGVLCGVMCSFEKMELYVFKILAVMWNNILDLPVHRRG